MGICFVIQPFDNGDFNKRYKDIIEPTIKKAELIPYRVDRDPGAQIPYQEIERKIEDAEICLADITEDNPNIWFEVGFAFALKKEVVLICNKSRWDKDKKFPFDIQHFSIITYQTGSTSDFEELSAKILEKIKAAKKRSDYPKTVRDISVTADKEGFSPHETATMVIIMGESITQPEGLSGYFITEQMGKLGFLPIAASISIKSLERNGYIISTEIQQDLGDPYYTAYSLTQKGEDWMLDNQNEFNLKREVEDGEIVLDDL